MKLSDQLNDYIRAAFSGIWIQTSEADEAEREILRHAKSEQWKAAVWDVAAGLRVMSAKADAQPDSGGGDPLAALRALPSLADQSGTAILVMHNLHRFFNNPEVIQATFRALVAGKQQRTFVVVLAPVVVIPPELEKIFVVLDHALPDREALASIARELATDNPDDLPNGDQLHRA